VIRAARLAAMLAVAALLAGGCGHAKPERPDAAAAAPFADCASLTSPQPAPPGGKGLPDVELPCFTGGQTVDIGHIRGPALINLWASWCSPCRAELPTIQRLAERAAGRVHVIGVVSSDDRDAAQSLARDLGITFPAVFDRQGSLLRQVGAAGLPVTLFVDGQGQISHTYNGEPLGDAALARLADRYLGVVVPA
jgi:thiol-disulfide isomerase/thioredoxin